MWIGECSHTRDLDGGDGLRISRCCDLSNGFELLFQNGQGVCAIFVCGLVSLVFIQVVEGVFEVVHEFVTDFCECLKDSKFIRACLHLKKYVTSDVAVARASEVPPVDLAVATVATLPFVEGEEWGDGVGVGDGEGDEHGHDHESVFRENWRCSVAPQLLAIQHFKNTVVRDACDASSVGKLSDNSANSQ